MILTIAARELRALFLSPLAWTMLSVVLFLLAWIFLLLLQDYLGLQAQLLAMEGAPGVTDLVAAPVLHVAAWLLLLVTPLLTMRLISEERRSGTLNLLLSAPVGVYQIVLGKYLGILAFLLILVMLITLLPLSLLIGAELDLGKLLAGVLGLILLLASFAAAGLYLSILSAQPAVAAVASFGLLLFLWIIDAASAGRDDTSSLFAYLSLLRHFNALSKGLFNSVDVVFYLLFIMYFLGLAMHRLAHERWRR